MKKARSIRTYLLLLAFAIMLPFLLLHTYIVYYQAQQEIQTEKNMLASLAHLAAGDAEHFMADAKLVLLRLAERPELRSLDPIQCETFLRLFPCGNPNFCSISVVAASGKLICTVAESGLPVADVTKNQDWLHKVIETNSFVISEPIVDKEHSRDIILLGQPLRDSQHKTVGVVAIAVDLLQYDSVHYKTALENAQLPPGSVVTIVDTAGSVIARWPNAEHWVATNASNVPIVKHLLGNSDSSTLQARGMDGINKLYGVADIRNTNWHLYTGIPASVLLTPLHGVILQNIILGLITAILATVLALYLSGLISNPIRSLSRLALDNVDGHIRTHPIDTGPYEIIELGRSFNEMLLAREKAVYALAEEKERAEITLASIGDAVITTDAIGNVTYLNPVAEQLTGWNSMQARGLPLFKVANFIDLVSGKPLRKTLEQAIENGYLVSVRDNAVLVNRHGQEYAIADCAAPIRDQQGVLIGTVLVFRDITKTQELTHKLSWQATHDALTGIYNRVEFERRLKDAIASAKQDNLQHALLYLDLDQFKIVNDTCGHAAGDELLRHLTALLQEEVRGVDVFARLGGDEFGVLLENCPLDQALRIAEEFRETIQDFRLSWNSKSFSIGVSIGVVSITVDSGDGVNVLSAADAACYAAKEKGRNCVLVYQADKGEVAKHVGAMQWVQRINDAFEENRFLLFSQNIKSLSNNGENTNFQEVLIRMLDETGNILLPGVFLPAAERYNLMPTIDRWVVRTLFSHMAEQTEKDNEHVTNFVNISGPTFSDPQFMEFVIDQFAQTDLSPKRICFEITESAAILNLNQAKRFISVLRNMGCKFALDDFGTGISSFAYLKSLPVDYLKIAGDFILNLKNNTSDIAFVEAINHIGHVMNLNTIGEWAENEEAVEMLRKMGVDFVQGFGVSIPVPLDIRKTPATVKES